MTFSLQTTLSRTRRLLPVVLLCTSGLWLTSCFDDDDSKADKYKDWRERNDHYLDSVAALRMSDGTPYYTKVVPSWAPGTYVLMHWHNDRALTERNLVPMDNSITSITYELYNIDGVKISDSFSNADSLYTSRPSSNIIGMWAGLTHMHVGDSVTMVMPSSAGYGTVQQNVIPPYSTLVYNVKLKAIPAYEVP